MTKQLLKCLPQLRKLVDSLTRMEMKEMVRRVCREEGLNAVETNLICAVIECESSFNPNAINFNDGRTTDFGICQWNNYWSWTREKIIQPKDAFNNPELAVKKMVEMYVKYGTGVNGLGRFICYSGKYHLKYM